MHKTAPPIVYLVQNVISVLRLRNPVLESAAQIAIPYRVFPYRDGKFVFPAFAYVGGVMPHISDQYDHL